MRRLTRYVPTALLVLGIATPFAAGCGLLKPKENDAGADGSAVAPAVPDTTQPANPAQPATPAAPLNPATPAHPVTPVAHTDGGTAADSGAHTDGGAPAPMPTFPGFDAGALKGFDAGGLFRVPDGGFKPPPWPAPPK